MKFEEAIKITKLYCKIRDAYYKGLKFTKGRKKFNKETKEALQVLLDYSLHGPEIDEGKLAEVIHLFIGNKKKDKITLVIRSMAKEIVKKSKRWLK